MKIYDLLKHLENFNQDFELVFGVDIDGNNKFYPYPLNSIVLHPDSDKVEIRLSN